MSRILVLQGPNLNLLGKREPEKYGTTTLADIHAVLSAKAAAAGVEFEAFQSNAESELVGKIQSLFDRPADFLILNPAAFTHTSVALRDAISAVRVPFIEVHLSNVFAREAFRHHSYFTDIAVGMICGLGAKGYELAMDYALARI
jgi:3-dehydroquinate dehydratase-2